MSNPQVGRGRIYRFGDNVAVSFHGQDIQANTLYIPADLAYHIAALMHDAAQDIIDCPKFSESVHGTWIAETTPAGGQIRKE